MIHSPAPWEAWFEKDEEGFIIHAGVDTARREANICVTTCENVEADDIEAANAYIVGDTMLLAAAPELLAEVKHLLASATYRDGQATVLTQDLEALEAVIAKLEA